VKNAVWDKTSKSKNMIRNSVECKKRRPETTLKNKKTTGKKVEWKKTLARKFIF
jgi:hypothetical protein